MVRVKKIGIYFLSFLLFSGCSFIDEPVHEFFDKILISQAIENDLTIITTDGNIPLYEVKTIW